jgi:hypothetical protein
MESNTAKNVLIKMPPIAVHVGAIGMMRFSSEFLHALMHWKPRDRGFSPVPHYLVCRSLELCLKSFLLARGVDRNRLAHKIVHNLVSALNLAEEMGLARLIQISSEECVALEAANALYQDKQFEYFESVGMVFGKMELPSLDLLTPLAARLIERLEPVCLKATDGPVGQHDLRPNC